MPAGPISGAISRWLLVTRGWRPGRCGQGPIRTGVVTCSIRIWKQPHVKIGGRYALLEGEIEVTGLQEISLGDITPKLAKRSGFESVPALMKIAKHGRGERIFLVEFHYLPPG